MWIYLILGLLILAFSGDMLVKGAVDISKILKVSPFIIAGTLVAFGTSAPELFVSLRASIEGSPGAAIGNILGSNFANVFLALGAAALVQTIKFPKNMSSFDIKLLVFSTIIFTIIIMILLEYSKWLGLFLIISLFVYIYYSFKNNNLSETDNKNDENVSKIKSIIFFLIGLVGVLIGSDFLVNGAIEIANNFGVREAVIGVGILAFGTSLPEVATSIIAALKKENNIALGNIVGSSIFNILAIGGVTLLASSKLDLVKVDINLYDLSPFILSSLIILIFYKFKLNIHKLFGFLFVLFYILWITLIFLN